MSGQLVLIMFRVDLNYHRDAYQPDSCAPESAPPMHQPLANFSSVCGGRHGPDFRKALDGVAKRVGWKDGEIRSKMLRHTYCAARLQTLGRGAPVSPFTVGKEMGHGGDALVKRVYGHLGEVAHRSEFVSTESNSTELRKSSKG